MTPWCFILKHVKAPRNASRCYLEDCVEYTQHKSGVCAPHRTHTCRGCAKAYVLEVLERNTIASKLCAACRKQKSKLKLVNAYAAD